MHENPKNKEFYIPTLAIIGVGMIGGSLARALKGEGGRAGHVGRVVGAGRARASLEKALELGVIDAIADSPLEAAAAADMVVLAAPVGATGQLLRAIAPCVDARKVVTDVGSVKGGVCDAAAAELGAAAARFVAGHPVAGKEHSGVGAAQAGLFAAHNVVLTPTARTAADALAAVRRMWRAAGARVISMDAAQHDRILALTSHLPHVLAYAMVDLFAAAGEIPALAGAESGDGDGNGDGDHGLRSDMAAGGFYDFTRTASSDPQMWRDICLMNGAEIVHRLAEFTERIHAIAERIVAGDGAELERIFKAAAHTRAQVAARRARLGGAGDGDSDSDGDGGEGGGDSNHGGRD